VKKHLVFGSQNQGKVREFHALLKDENVALLSWNDFDHPKLRDLNFVYPTIDGVIDTIAWEGFREGVDDVRYITTLENYIKIARSTPGIWERQEIIDAEKYVKKLKTGLAGRADLNSVRQEIIAHILKIHVLLDF